MNDLDDKDLTDIFGVLREEEAPVSSSAWSSVAESLPAKSFWQFSWTSLNVFSVVAGLLMVSLVMAFFLTSDPVSESSGPGKADVAAGKPDNNGTQDSGVENSGEVVTGSAGIHSKNVPEEIGKNTADKSGTDPGNLSETVQNSVGHSNQVTGSDAPGSNNQSKVDSVAHTDFVKPVTVEPKTVDTHESQVAEAPAKKGKKIIVFEEDTILKIDTVFKEKKVKKGKKF
jgi:hypothetical protein